MPATRGTSPSPASTTPSLRGGRRPHRRRGGEPRRRHGGGPAAPRHPGHRPGRRRARIAERMQAFGSPSLVNPFDRFGDHLRLALRAPASYQLLTWLESGPGARAARPRRARRATGRWVVCGYGRLGRELTADLRAEGLDVTGHRPPAGGRRGRRRAGGRRLRPLGAGAGGPRPRRRARRRHGQRHDQPLAGRGGPAQQPAAVPRGPAEPAGQRAAVRRDGARRPAGADRGDRARGLRAAVHAAALAVPARDAGAGRRLGRRARRPAHRAVRRRSCRRCGRCG